MSEDVRAAKKYEPRLKTLTTSFADMRAGQVMAIGTPQTIIEIVKEIPRGSEWALSDIRKRLAERLKADVACPVTTSMYLKLAIEEEVLSGRSRFRFPFWRAVSPSSQIFLRLSATTKATISSHRVKEGLG